MKCVSLRECFIRCVSLRECVMGCVSLCECVMKCLSLRLRECVVTACVRCIPRVMQYECVNNVCEVV